MLSYLHLWWRECEMMGESLLLLMRISILLHLTWTVLCTHICLCKPGPYSVMSHDNSWKFYCKYSLNLCLNGRGLTIGFAPFILKQGSCRVNNTSKKFYICHFSSWYLKGIVISWNSLIIFKRGQHSYCDASTFQSKHVQGWEILTAVLVVPS